MILLFAAGVLSACAGGPIAGEFSPRAAREEARRDFAAGAPKIYRAGGYASFEPGISESERRLVAKLPRESRMAGCTNPRVKYSVGFATAYNREMILLLQTKRRGPAADGEPR